MKTFDITYYSILQLYRYLLSEFNCFGVFLPQMRGSPSRASSEPDPSKIKWYHSMSGHKSCDLHPPIPENIFNLLLISLRIHPALILARALSFFTNPLLSHKSFFKPFLHFCFSNTVHLPTPTSQIPSPRRSLNITLQLLVEGPFSNSPSHFTF